MPPLFFVFINYAILNGMKVGLFIGRFQPLHYGHLRMIKDIAAKVDHLIIGLGSSDVKLSCKNPFTVQERKEMITRAAKEIGLKKYEIVEIPDTRNDEDWLTSLKKVVPSFTMAWSGSEWVLRVLTEHRLPVTRIKEFPGLSGTKIRKHIIKGQPWLKYIPRSLRSYVKEIKTAQRVRDVCK